MVYNYYYQVITCIIINFPHNYHRNFPVTASSVLTVLRPEWASLKTNNYYFTLIKYT